MEISDIDVDMTIISEDELCNRDIQNSDGILTPRFMVALSDRLQGWHNEIGGPCKGEYIEEYILYSCKYAGFKNVIGDPSSHSVGEDLRILHNNNAPTRISCKSGKLKYDKKTFSGDLKDVLGLEISSVRTTKHKTLVEKLKHINTDHEDIIISLSSTLLSDCSKYVLTIISPIKYGEDVIWEIYGKDNNNYRCKMDGVSARIVHSMSGQLWYTITEPYVSNKYILGVREIYVKKTRRETPEPTENEINYWTKEEIRCKKYTSSK